MESVSCIKWIRYAWRDWANFPETGVALLTAMRLAPSSGELRRPLLLRSGHAGKRGTSPSKNTNKYARAVGSLTNHLSYRQPASPCKSVLHLDRLFATCSIASLPFRGATVSPLFPEHSESISTPPLETHSGSTPSFFLPTLSPLCVLSASSHLSPSSSRQASQKLQLPTLAIKYRLFNSLSPTPLSSCPLYTPVPHRSP